MFEILILIVIVIAIAAVENRSEERRVEYRVHTYLCSYARSRVEYICMHMHRGNMG